MIIGQAWREGVAGAQTRGERGEAVAVDLRELPMSHDDLIPSSTKAGVPKEKNPTQRL